MIQFVDDGLIDTIKTSTIQGVDSMLFAGDAVKVLWGPPNHRNEYKSTILFLSDEWSACKRFELEFEEKENQKENSENVDSNVAQDPQNLP